MKSRVPLLLAALTPTALPATTLVAGWDAFNSTTNPTATQLSTDTTASLATSATGGNWDDWNNNLYGASSDGTFGSLSSTVASASTDVGTGSNQGTNLSLNRSVKPGTITITLTNDSTVDRLMGGFYFDAIRRNSQSAPNWTLTYGGAISGTAASGTLTTGNMMGVTAAERDWAVDLTGLTDNVWEAGSDVIFTLTFSGGDTSTGTGGGQETCVDNIGITVIPTPQPIVKADNTDDLNLGTSWVGGVAPASPDFATWDNTVTGGNTTAVLGADATWGGIVVEDPAGLVTIDSGNTLTLDGNIFAVDLSSATADLVLNCNLAVDGSASWDVATGRTLTAGGGISGTSGIDKQGDGTAILSSASNSYVGDTTVTAGTLQLGASEVIPHGGGGGASGNVTVDGTLDLNTFDESLNGLSGSGVIDTVAGGTPTLTVGYNGQPGTFNGTLQNTSGTLSLTKFGTNTLTLGGANTYSGATTVSGGTLEVTNPSALGNTSGITLADGTTFVPALDGLTVTAPITLDTTGTASTISAPTSGGTGGLVQTLTLNGVISGDGDLTFAANNSDNTYGTIVLGAANDYTGATRIDNPNSLYGANCFVKNGVANALPTTTVLTLDGFSGIGSGRQVTYDLNGFDQTLAGLTNVPNFDRKQFVTSTGGSATLTVNNAADFTFGVAGGGDGVARIQGAISLTKSGAGTFTLVNTHTYTGTTAVNDGTLELDDASLASDLSVSGGASLQFILGLPSTTSGSLDLTTGTVKIDGVPDGSSDYQLMTATGGITGTPTLDSPITDYVLEMRNGDTELWLAYVAAGGYTAWASTNAPTGTAEDDYDGDGVSNGVEYVLGGDKDTNDLGKLPGVGTSGGDMTFTFVRDQASIDGSTIVEIEVGTTLASWPDVYSVPDAAAANNPGVTVVKDSPSAGLDTVTLTIARTPDAAKFGRLKVTVP